MHHTGSIRDVKSMTEMTCNICKAVPLNFNCDLDFLFCFFFGEKFL